MYLHPISKKLKYITWSVTTLDDKFKPELNCCSIHTKPQILINIILYNYKTYHLLPCMLDQGFIKFFKIMQNVLLLFLYKFNFLQID